SIALIVTAGSFIISNQGLETIISYSVPVLVFIYPIAIVLIILPFISRFIPQRKAFYRGAIFFTFFISLYDGLTEFGLEMPGITPYMEVIPFLEIGLGWLIPAIIGGLLGIMIGQLSTKSKDSKHGAALSISNISLCSFSFVGLIFSSCFLAFLLVFLQNLSTDIFSLLKNIRCLFTDISYGRIYA